MRGDLKWHEKRTRIKGHEEEGSAALKTRLSRCCGQFKIDLKECGAHTDSRTFSKIS
jgi:hypothetical protein